MSGRLRATDLGPVVAGLLFVGAASAAAPPQAELSARAEALLAEQQEHLRQGRRAEVLADVDKTIGLFEQLGDPHAQASALVLRALAREEDGGGRARTADLEAALALLDGAGDPLGSWLVVWMLAEAEYREGRLERADALLLDGLGRLERAAASPDPLDLRGLERFGGTTGAPVGMLDSLREIGPAAAFVKPILIGFLELPLRETRIGVLIELDRLDEAEAELGRATARSALFGGLMDGSLHRRRGDLRRRQWRLDEARESYEAALAAPSLASIVPFAREDVFAWAPLDSLAEVEVLSGRLPAALAWNERALEQARESGNCPRQAAVIRNRARLYLDHGDLTAAREDLSRAEALARELDDDYLLANVLGDLGTVAFIAASYESAASYLEQSVAILERLEEPFVAAPTLLLLAECYQMLGAPERTAEILERAGELAVHSEFRQAQELGAMLAVWNRFVASEASQEELRQALEGLLEAAGPLLPPQFPGSLRLGLDVMGGDAEDEAQALARELLTEGASPLATAFARLTLGLSHMRRGEDVAAATELGEAERLFAQLGQRDLLGMVRAAIAALHWRGGERERAVDELSDAVASLETVIGEVQVEELLASFLGERESLYHLFVEMLAAAGRPDEAFLQAERSRSRALLQLLGNQRLRPPTGTDPAQVAQANALRARMTAWERQIASLPPEAAAERQRVESDLAEARRRYEDLMVRIKVQSPEHAALASVEPPPVAAIQAALDPGVTLISYFLTRAGSHAWKIDRDRIERVPLELTPADLLEVSCWVDEVGRGQGGTPISRGGTGAARGATVRPSCASGHDLAGRLYRLLIAPLDPASLGERLVIVPHGLLHYVPFAALRDPATGRYLVQDHELTLVPSASIVPFLRKTEAPVRGRALVLGAPAIEDDLPQLEGALAEAGAAAALFGVEPLLGQRATEAAVFGAAGEIDLLHVAAHAVYHPRSPRFSRVLLAPGDGRDGRLEVHEAFAELDLSGVQLVVLSACQTAVGPDAGGDEIVSLTRAFLYSGSAGVLSTLWAVHDDASAELMKGFYRRLLGGEPAAAALRGAQIEMLGGDHADPYYWAGYTLTGDPRARWAPEPAAGDPRAEVGR